jgi:hypothetical protein
MHYATVMPKADFKRLRQQAMISPLILTRSSSYRRTPRSAELRILDRDSFSSFVIYSSHHPHYTQEKHMGTTYSVFKQSFFPPKPTWSDQILVAKLFSSQVRLNKYACACVLT